MVISPHLVQAGRDLAIVQATQSDELGFGEIDADFLPGLSHRTEEAILIVRIHPATGEGEMGGRWIVGRSMRASFDEEDLGSTGLDP